jgi:hypothetical protein
MSRRAFLALVLAILALAGLLRTVWLTSDPPSTAVNSVGVVWHDEGAWVHNARNRALWGEWRTDNWNPVFLAPVFTVLEYVAFEAFGVGMWQARLVPVVSGLAAIAFLIAGLTALAGRRAALLGGALLAGNYAFVMWNRAALMESTMTALIVISWSAYALAARRPGWAFVSGVAAVLAFFTKASAAFYIAALAIEAVTALLVPGFRGSGVPGLESSGTTEPRNLGTAEPRNHRLQGAALFAILGLISAAVLIGAFFVLPFWSEFRFYNWQMSVARKPEYSLQALVMRASWLPLVHSFFTWMWPMFLAGSLAMVDIATRARSARPAERLLVLWVLVGLLELIVHDSGNERRYVMFLPALIALGVVWLAGATRPDTAVPRAAGRWIAAPLVLGLGYLAAGSALRVPFFEEVRAGRLHDTVVLSAMAAVAVAAVAFVAWPHVSRWVGRPRVPLAVALAIVAATLAFDLARYGSWAQARQTLNYQASREVGRWLPPGTLVQGKLANGLALENRIRPVFIGNGFGNYEDRLRRDDVRYILTYVSPSVGFESQAGSGMIQELLDHYPRHRNLATFAVTETGGPDRAALIDKFPGP